MTKCRGVSAAVILLGVASLAGCAGTPDIDKQHAADTNANVGAEYLRNNYNEQASDAFQRALHYDSDNFTANWGLAVASERLDSPDQARRYFERALHIRQAPVVYNSYGVFLCEQGDTAAGLKNFQQALASPNEADKASTLANAGLCLTRAGRPNEARGYFEKALVADPAQPQALTNLADMAYHAGNYMRARAFIERADAATTLSADDLLLAARIEQAMGEQGAATSYLKRYNANQPAATKSLSQLESSRP